MPTFLIYTRAAKGSGYIILKRGTLLLFSHMVSFSQQGINFILKAFGYCNTTVYTIKKPAVTGRFFYYYLF